VSERCGGGCVSERCDSRDCTNEYSGMLPAAMNEEGADNRVHACAGHRVVRSPEPPLLTFPLVAISELLRTQNCCAGSCLKPNFQPVSVRNVG
jgi:hypothetical protein